MPFIVDSTGKLNRLNTGIGHNFTTLLDAWPEDTGTDSHDDPSCCCGPNCGLTKRPYTCYKMVVSGVQICEDYAHAYGVPCPWTAEEVNRTVIVKHVPGTCSWVSSGCDTSGNALRAVYSFAFDRDNERIVAEIIDPAWCGVDGHQSLFAGELTPWGHHVPDPALRRFIRQPRDGPWDLPAVSNNFFGGSVESGNPCLRGLVFECSNIGYGGQAVISPAECSDDCTATHSCIHHSGETGTDTDTADTGTFTSGTGTHTSTATDSHSGTTGTSTATGTGSGTSSGTDTNTETVTGGSGTECAGCCIHYGGTISGSPATDIADGTCDGTVALTHFDDPDITCAWNGVVAGTGHPNRTITLQADFDVYGVEQWYVTIQRAPAYTGEFPTPTVAWSTPKTTACPPATGWTRYIGASGTLTLSPCNGQGGGDTGTGTGTGGTSTSTSTGGTTGGTGAGGGGVTAGDCSVCPGSSYLTVPYSFDFGTISGCSSPCNHISMSGTIEMPLTMIVAGGMTFAATLSYTGIDAQFEYNHDAISHTGYFSVTINDRCVIRGAVTNSEFLGCDGFPGASLIGQDTDATGCSLSSAHFTLGAAVIHAGVC